MPEPEPYMIKYLRYIINTKAIPLEISYFDDDWYPIGSTIRKELEDAGLIRIDGMNIWLNDAGRDYLNASA